MSRTAPLPAWWVGEFAGTFLLVFFGCGSVATALLPGVQIGSFQVAMVWGLGIATAIYLTASLSGAHLNPAVTLALATNAGFSWRLVPGYLLAQSLGAFAASAVLYAILADPLRVFEATHHLVRGTPGSEASAMIFGEFFPHPGGQPFTENSRALISPTRAFAIETVGTAILVLVILAVTDPRNSARPGRLTPVIIGLTVTMLISLFGPFTMAGFNPARDFAPRVFSSLAGWGSVPFVTNGKGWLTVYIVAPMLGGQAGGLVYRIFFRPHYRRATA